MTEDIKRVEVRDLDRAAPRFAKMGALDALMRAQPTALDGTDLSGSSDGVRAALARWITAADNAWFARAFVNRMWAHFVGRGFVDPVDDLRPTNSPAAQGLFDALSADFVASGYDVKHLVKIVAGAEVYGLSDGSPGDETMRADPELKLWERFRVTSLGSEELLNALVAATGVDAIVRASGRFDLAELRFKVRRRYEFLFDVDEESHAPDYEGTISQALALLNGGVTATGASLLPGGALAEIVGTEGDDPSKIEMLYLRTLSRFPGKDEVDHWVSFVSDSASVRSGTPSVGGPVAQAQRPDPLRRFESVAGSAPANALGRAYEDLLWALLNSSEFVLNH